MGRASHFGMGVVGSTIDDDAEVGKVTVSRGVCVNGVEVNVSVNPVEMGNDDALLEEANDGEGGFCSCSFGRNLRDNPYSVLMGQVEAASSLTSDHPPSLSYLPLVVSADPSPSAPLPTSFSVSPSELFPLPSAHPFLLSPPSALF